MRWSIIIFTLFFAGCEFLSNNYIEGENSNSRLPEGKVTIGNQTFQVEIANTPRARRQGLMFRQELEAGHGMLFPLEKERIAGFWMKNTFIPLDIIWISADKKVVEVKTLPPCNIPVCPVYKPEHQAKYVLEVNADEFQGGVGDSVEIED